MKYLIIFSVLIIIGISFSGCQYTIINNGENTYRLNTITGKTCLIDGLDMFVLSPPVEIKNISEVKNWEEMEITGEGISVNLSTTWLDGKLYYQLYVYPYKSKISKMLEVKYSYELLQNVFNVCMKGQGDISLIDIPIKLSELTSLVDSNNKYTGFRTSGSVVCNYKKYLKIKDYSLSWYF